MRLSCGWDNHHYLFSKVHNLLYSSVLCYELINISDHINTDGAGEVIAGPGQGGADAGYHQAGEHEQEGLHLQADRTRVITTNDLRGILYFSFILY